jgi:hypothetical protein
LKHYTSVAIHASRGILQEAMSLVSNEPRFDNFELLSTKQDIAASQVYKKYGYNMRDIVKRESDEGVDIKDGDAPSIEFTPSKQKTGREKRGSEHGIYFNSYVPGSETIRGENSTHFKENSHANFTSLINYIERANADLVIVDNYRTKQGPKLVEQLKARDINAECQPVYGQHE